MMIAKLTLKNNFNTWYIIGHVKHPQHFYAGHLFMTFMKVSLLNPYGSK